MIALAASNGFRKGYEISSSSVSVSVLAGEGTGMERDYDFTSAVYGSELESPSAIGRRAGEKAVKRLNPRKVATARVPIVFDPRVSNSLVGHLAGAINGAGIARGVSFLKDKMGQRVFPAGIDIVDDPHRRRGLRSKPFDGEGLANRRRALVEDGVLKTWVLDLRSARQLEPQEHRPCRARHLLAARPVDHQSLSGGGQATPQTAHGRYRERLLLHRADRLRRQQRDRRLQPGRLGLLDRERRDRLSGLGDHHRRQSDRDVQAPAGGQRSDVPLRHQRADTADRRDDRGRALAANRLCLSRWLPQSFDASLPP